MLSTNDFAPTNPLINFTYGCFNHHIAHHLFPSLSHVYYPEITKIIREFAMENNLPYRCFSAKEAITSHFKLLRNNAYRENIFEETM
jgi:linoleoyl-CoA desaturase